MSFTYGILYKVLGVILCSFIHGDLLKPCDNQSARDMSLFQLTSVEAGRGGGHLLVLFDFSVHMHHLGVL